MNMESVVDRIRAAIRRECLQVLAEGQGTPQQIDTAFLEVFGNKADAHCKSMDAEGLDSVISTEEKYSRDPTSYTRALDFLKKSYVEKGRLGDDCEAECLYPAPRTAITPTLYFLDIAGDALRDITKAGRSGRVLSGGFDGRPPARHCLEPARARRPRHQPIHTTPLLDQHGHSRCRQRAHQHQQPRRLRPSHHRRPRQQRPPQPQATNHPPRKQHALLLRPRRPSRAALRCAFDGSALTPLVRTRDPSNPAHAADESRWCVGVAVDRERGHLYWSQKGPSKGGQGRICRTGLEMPAHEHAGARSDIETLFQGLPECVDLELESEAGMLYWADRGEVPLGNSINRAYVGPDRAEYLEKTHPLEQKLGYVMLANLLHEPISIRLDKRNGCLYATDLGGAIYRFRLDGGGRERIYEYLGVYTGLALAYE